MKNSRKRWVSITLLSIVIPVGLLVTFRLTGVLQEPLTPEIVGVEAVSWNVTRPTEHNVISEKATNTYSIDSTYIEMNVAIYNYRENSASLPFGGNDGLSIGLTATANVSSDFVHSAVVRFSHSDDNAFLDINEDPDVIFLRNVELQRIVDLRPESYIEVLGVNRPDYCQLEMILYWVFFDKNNVDHEITVTLEVTYFNGTAYRKAVLPIQLGVFVR